MRRYLLAAWFIIVIAGCTSDKIDVVGEWVGTDKEGTKMTFIFDKDGYATMISGNEVIGGKNVKTGNRTVSAKYAFDLSKEPAWLDIIFFEDQKESMRMKSIVKFIGKSKMQLKGNDFSVRPAAFDGDKDEALFIKTR